MMVSPFTFYRGAAKIMATDLAGTPTAGFTSQLCGDAHLSNFGVFASPERRLVFDLNDFDETLPGPFEYDVKRMAASFTIAARNNGLTKAECAQVTKAAVRAYREAMAGFARMGVMELWYTRMSEEDLQAAVGRLGRRGQGGQGRQGHQGGARTARHAARPNRVRRSRPRRPRNRARTRGCANRRPGTHQRGVLGEAGGEESQQGAYPGQSAGAVQARPNASTGSTGS